MEDFTNIKHNLRQLNEKVDDMFSLLLEIAKNMTINGDLLLTVKDVAYICNVSDGTVYNWVNSNKLSGMRIQRHLYFEVETIQTFLKSYLPDKEAPIRLRQIVLSQKLP